MFLSYEVVATFGVSALLSFAISATVLLTFAAKRGLLRAGGTRSPLLVPPTSILKEKAPELTPLAASN